MSFTALAGLIASCGHNDYAPKPKAYLRFEFPEQKYGSVDELFSMPVNHVTPQGDTTELIVAPNPPLPFTFEVNQTEAVVDVKKNTPREKWVDILYPHYKGVVYLSYIPLRGPQDLAGQIDTSYQLMKKHFNHSSGVEEEQFVNPSHHVYATTFHLKGSKVASTYQFYATDSTRHYLRGSLYLDQTPNNDSLAPVLNYLQQDLNHLIETLQWR